MSGQSDPASVIETPHIVTTATALPMWQRALVLLSGAVVTLILVLFLQWGRPVLIPIALAVLLTFLLNPIVKTLHRRGLSQILSVTIAVSVAGIILLCLGWMVTKQISGMLTELPRNTERIKAKLKTLKQIGTGPTQQRIGQMIEEISSDVFFPAEKSRTADGQDSGEQVDIDSHNGTVIIRSEPSKWMNLSEYVGTAFEGLGTLAFAIVLLVFFMIEREDLRDRVVLLAGRARLAVTSKALEDITDRISRYIGMVAMINGGFGLVLTIGLFALGVPFALLWGFVAAMLRFLPYIGPWIGAIFPITMSFAMSDGWGQPLAVLAFVAVVELVTNNAVEPLLFGHTTGVSPTALLVSAASWLYLWGPVGLVLSAPFAVCLVVLGKNIPQLGFLYLLLGDKPALNADYSFYQRLMLGDFHEAAQIAAKQARVIDREKLYDEMLVPVLNYTKRDVQRGYLNDEDEQSILAGMRVTLSRLKADLDDSTTTTKDSESADAVATIEQPIPLRILGCPATDDSDVLALEMLGQMLDPTRWKLEIQSLETLTSELIDRIKQDPPAIVLIASTPPGGLQQCRYLCKRLQRAVCDQTLMVCRCGLKRRSRSDREQLEQAGAQLVTTTLLESRKLLNARWSLLNSSGPASSSASQAEIPSASHMENSNANRRVWTEQFHEVS